MKSVGSLRIKKKKLKNTPTLRSKLNAERKIQYQWLGLEQAEIGLLLQF